MFLFENYTLDPDRRELRLGSKPIAIEPQVFDLLIYLVQNCHRVVSKDDLIASVWNGRIVSDSTLTSRINAARKAVGDSGENQKFIRTIARKGFRFVGALREQHVSAIAKGERKGDEQELGRPLPTPVLDRPSIAVLPFDNLSDDRSLEIVVDGLVEDVIALLARVRGFFVIARASSLGYREHPCEIRQIGTELGVRYVVTGSVRGSGARMRVGTHLIEADSGAQLWASRYDVERGDVLDLQDRIAREIIRELEPALTRAEMAIFQRRRSEDFTAWSHYRQAVGVIALGGWNEETLAEAISQLCKAIAQDANFALPRALLALLTGMGSRLSLVPGAIVEIDVLEQANRAIDIDPHDSEVLGYAGCALADIGDVKRGSTILQRAVELDPSNAQALVALGAAQIQLEQFSPGIENLKLGIRLSPRDFRLSFWGMLLADALIRIGSLDEALAEALLASRCDTRLHGARVVTSWAMVRLNRLDEARQVLAEARRIRPQLSLGEIKRFFGTRAAADLSAVWNLEREPNPSPKSH
jgi:TolB-like protein